MAALAAPLRLLGCALPDSTLFPVDNALLSLLRALEEISPEGRLAAATDNQTDQRLVVLGRLLRADAVEVLDLRCLPNQTLIAAGYLEVRGR